MKLATPLALLGNVLNVPPSPRPLLIWLGADGVCAALLALASVALLALWRRPYTPWRLGLVALALSWFGGAATLLVYLTYHNLAPIADSCLATDSCARPIEDAQLWVAVVSVALIAATLVVLLAALVDASGRADGVERDRWDIRALGLLTAEAVAGAGVLLLAHGVFDWVQVAPSAAHPGDALGLIPLVNAIAETLFGAAVFASGGAVLAYLTGLLLSRRSRAATSVRAVRDS